MNLEGHTVRKKMIAIVAILAVLGGGGYYWQTTRSKAAAAAAQPQYVFATVRRGDIGSTISGSGPVTSVNGVLVKSNQTGTVTRLLAQDGDTVAAGQVVVEMVNETLANQVRQAEIDVQTSQASLDNLLNPQATAVRAQMLKVENARLTLKQRQQDQANLTVTAPKGGVISSVKVVEATDVASNTVLFTIFNDQAATFVMQVPQQAAPAIRAGEAVQVTLPGFDTVEGRVTESAAAATPGSGNRDATVPISIALPPLPGLRAGMVGQARLTADGLDYLVQANGSVLNDALEVRSKVAGTVADIEVAEGDRVEAGAQLLRLTSEAVQIQLQQAENDLQTQEQELDNLVSPENDPDGQLGQLRNKLETARVTLASRQADLADLQVKAPVSGQISSLKLKVGDRVTANGDLFRVADYGQMQITIGVDELDVANAKVGQAATITLDALPGKTYRGKVLKINPEGTVRNDIATFDVTIQVEKPEGLLAGMNASVNVVVSQKQNVLWLPAQAVTVRGGRAFVQVLTDGKVEQKEVQVGLRTAQQVEIVGGLNEGDQVIQTIVRQTTGAAQGFNIMGGGGTRPQNQTTVPAGQAPAGGFQRGQGQGQAPTPAAPGR
jgi:HlyD family secretion protein